MGKARDFIDTYYKYSSALLDDDIKHIENLFAKDNVLVVKGDNLNDVLKIYYSSKVRPPEFKGVRKFSFLDNNSNNFGKRVQRALHDNMYIIHINYIDVSKVLKMLGKENSFYNVDYYNKVVADTGRKVINDLKKGGVYKEAMEMLGSKKTYEDAIKLCIKDRVDIQTFGTDKYNHYRVDVYVDNDGKIYFSSGGFTTNLFLYDLRYKLNSKNKGSAKFKK